MLQIADWTGGNGTKPDTGGYIGTNGIVTDINDGVNIKGAKGRFYIDASDTFANRDNYDDEALGFTFLATDQGKYIKQSNTSADWNATGYEWRGGTRP